MFGGISGVIIMDIASILKKSWNGVAGVWHSEHGNDKILPVFTVKILSRFSRGRVPPALLCKEHSKPCSMILFGLHFFIVLDMGFPRLKVLAWGRPYTI